MALTQAAAITDLIHILTTSSFQKISNFFLISKLAYFGLNMRAFVYLNLEMTYLIKRITAKFNILLLLTRYIQETHKLFKYMEGHIILPMAIYICAVCLVPMYIKLISIM